MSTSLGDHRPAIPSTNSGQLHKSPRVEPRASAPMQTPHRWDKPIDSLPTGLIGMSAQRCQPDRTSKTSVLQCNQRVRGQAAPDQPRHGTDFAAQIRPLARFHRAGAHRRQGRLGSRDVPTTGHSANETRRRYLRHTDQRRNRRTPAATSPSRRGACSRASPGCARRVLSCRTSHASPTRGMPRATGGRAGRRRG
jgi:hypothetical protein